ncbi:hypothetical protein Clocel_4158 [Clostridium cellulovorans 743B]|uniref:Uncharacterized protein n=1 Tax=Clostridium cellulovorans (strain ATCC 35296 / DSM 3052 / OCM 3 / 743B) TaxID=573061 RepID=D9SMG3_CLOC7|nr:hypothetical protein Clocel_4158 [Clostridium cellulovorans 743B]
MLEGEILILLKNKNMANAQTKTKSVCLYIDKYENINYNKGVGSIEKYINLKNNY